MSKISIIIFLIVLLNFCVFARKKNTINVTDFVGTWILDENTSFRDSEDRENFDDYTLIITQNEPEIKIVQSYSFKNLPSEHLITIYTDKRGEENKYVIRKYTTKDFTGNDLSYTLEDVDLKSKTYFKKDKIFRQGNYKFSFANPILLKETYSLSDDGKKLTIITEKNMLTTDPGRFERQMFFTTTQSTSPSKLFFYKK